LKSPQNAIEEIQRVLKKDGRMIVSIPNPRTRHKLIYPSLFKFCNFREYLQNNRFIVKSATTYGICPPFWKYIKPFMEREYRREKLRFSQTEGEQSTFLSRIARLFSLHAIRVLMPNIFGWSFVFDCVNVDPSGARTLYREIAEETKEAYR
jgi:SAM-dependent methyltransferase